MGDKTDKLARFIEQNQSLSADLGLEELCRSLASGLMDTELDRCSVVVGTEYNGTVLIAGEEMAADDVEPERRDVHLHERRCIQDYPVIQYAIDHRQAVLIADAQGDGRLADQERQVLSGLGILSLIVCPMIARDRVTGYVLVQKRIAHGFVEQDVGLYAAMVGYMATMIAMARMASAMEQELEEHTRQAENFRRLAENAQDAICMATLGEHKLIYANLAYYTMHGYDPDDSVIGQVDDSFAFYEESQGSTITQITRQGGLRREHVHVRQDGSTFIGQDTVFAVRDRNGDTFALGNIIRDVTRQKDLETRLRELSERRTWQFEIMTEIAQDIATAPKIEALFERVVTLIKERLDYYHTHLYLLDEPGTMLALVEGYGEPGRILKAQGHQIPIGKGLVGTAARTGQPVLVPDVAKQANWLANPLLPDTRSELAVPIKMGDSVLGVLDVQSDQLNRFTKEDEELLSGLCGQIAVAIQNTRILARVQQLVDERTREVTIFQSLTENATYGVWMATPEGVVSYANEASHRMFGYTYEAENTSQERREMVGMLVEQFFTPRTARQFESQLPQILAGQSWQGESEGMRQDGKSFNLQVFAFAIFDEQGDPLSVAVISYDITEQKQLEDEQERLNHEIISAHERLIRDLSAPLIPITKDILVLPLIGSIDSVRAQQVMESMLQGVESYNAEVVIIDITGVPVLDTSVANHLIQMTNAAALLGAKTVLVGIMPSVAQTLVELGVDLSSITTRNNLQGGVEYALRTQGLHITLLRS